MLWPSANGITGLDVFYVSGIVRPRRSPASPSPVRALMKIKTTLSLCVSVCSLIAVWTSFK